MRQHFNVFMGCAYTNYSKLTLKEETYNQAESDSEENYSTEDKKKFKLHETKLSEKLIA